VEHNTTSGITWASAAVALCGTALPSFDGSLPNLGDAWSLAAAPALAGFILGWSRRGAKGESTTFERFVLATPRPNSPVHREREGEHGVVEASPPMALPRWVPLVRRPSAPKPEPESRVPHLYWFSAVCLILLLVRLWAWRASYRRANKAAQLEAERATKARRSAARHREVGESQLSTDVAQRLEDCVRLYREVRVSHDRRRSPGVRVDPGIAAAQLMIPAGVLTGRTHPTCWQAKYIEACEHLEWLRAHLPKVDDSIRRPSPEQNTARRLKELTGPGGQLFLLEKRGRICQEALETLVGSSDGWDVSVSDDGTKVSSRVRPMPGPNNMIDTKVRAGPLPRGTTCATPGFLSALIPAGVRGFVFPQKPLPLPVPHMVPPGHPPLALPPSVPPPFRYYFNRVRRACVCVASCAP
jgi:hypothetical protein